MIDMLWEFFVETGLWLRMILCIIPFVLWGLGVPVPAAIFIAYLLGGLNAELRENR
jgi:hypothetical protein